MSAEVRLCACGKPAGHQSVCNRDESDPDGIRVDRSYEETLAERNHERYLRRKRQTDHERKTGRLEMSSLQLHRLLYERSVTISTVKGSNPEPGRGGGERSGPPRQQELSDDPRWRESEHVIRSRLLRLHELLDEAEGLGPVEAKTMDSGEKDKRIIAEGEGLSPSAVVALLGTDIAGSASTVRRVRKQAGRSMVDGRRLEQDRPSDQTAPGVVRRVVIEE